ncbi:hypothetical protein QE152_g13947 [Popillia japonica]|uniref:Uncharacterized protein n=1 Tax=Popillia japonica TaxID=7064 RepID=A0AAW1L807_POPJA
MCRGDTTYVGVQMLQKKHIQELCRGDTTYLRKIPYELKTCTAVAALGDDKWVRTADRRWTSPQIDHWIYASPPSTQFTCK